MSNTEQIEFWNGETGKNWVAQADALDLLLQGVLDAVLARAQLKRDEQVLDIGCGSGVLTFAAQESVGDVGQALGVDISRPLIQSAQRRAQARKSRATFLEADAATWRAELLADAIVSRFGLMFFANPTAAFANIIQATNPGGRLTFACWRSPKENGMGGGMMKAVSHLFTPPDVKPDPLAPGPFAFADQTYVNTLLANAGWRDVQFEKWDGPLPLNGKDVHEIAAFLTGMGPIGRMMREQNIAIERVIDALVPFLETRNAGGQFALNGAAWIVSAHVS